MESVNQRSHPDDNLENKVPPSQPPSWLIRISEVFAGMEPDVFRDLGVQPLKKLGKEYHLVRFADPGVLRDSGSAKFVRWNIPVHHSWPCNPQEVPGFIEKAAQAIFRKFAGANPQALIIGPLDPGNSNRYYRSLASNLRGRALQLFPGEVGIIRDAEGQAAGENTLFCLLGKEGLFCGLQSPRASNGFFPGGTKFIPQNAAGTISRAGAKIAEALHYLKLHRELPAAGVHWLELGASPGGMTAELLARGYQVTAVDRAPLDRRLDHAAGLIQVVADAASFKPPAKMIYHAILSDMNGHAEASIQQVIRLSTYLSEGGLVVFTLKMPGVAIYQEANELEETVVQLALQGGLRRIACTHLTYNRHEFTLFFERDSIVL
jgi:23S rRNA (cytidine2498-2'-O)-methyltransferase